LHRYGSEGGEEDPTDTDGGQHHGGNQDGHYDDVDVDLEDGVLESLIIVGLAATLVVLVYVRQQRALRRGQQDQAAAAAGHGAAPPAANDRGLFPRPDDPEFRQWAAGGVGH
jgi:SEL1 protein